MSVVVTNQIQSCDQPNNTVFVESSWKSNTLVLLRIEGKDATVGVKDLLSAIANATNTNTCIGDAK